MFIILPRILLQSPPCLCFATLSFLHYPSLYFSDSKGKRGGSTVSGGGSQEPTPATGEPVIIAKTITNKFSVIGTHNQIAG
ncbi:hypothetical protein P3S67_023002 [Capsicum chacoense]